MNSLHHFSSPNSISGIKGMDTSHSNRNALFNTKDVQNTGDNLNLIDIDRLHKSLKFVIS